MSKLCYVMLFKLHRIVIVYIYIYIVHKDIRGRYFKGGYLALGV